MNVYRFYLQVLFFDLIKKKKKKSTQFMISLED